MPLSSAILLFQELDAKAKGLKHSLGLLEEIQPSEVHVSRSFSEPSSSVLPSPLAAQETGESRATASGNANSNVNDVISNPNYAVATIFIQGLEQCFTTWEATVSASNDDAANLNKQERAVVQECKNSLSTLKSSLKTSSPSSTYTSLYQLPNTFITKIKQLEKTLEPINNKVTNFWQSMMVTYNSMAAAIAPAANSVNVQIADLTMNIDDANTIISIIRQFASSLKDLLTPVWEIDASAITTTETNYDSMQASMSKLYIMLGDLYRMLMERYPSGQTDSLPTQVRVGIKQFVDSLYNLKMGSGLNINSNPDPLYIDDFLGIQYVYQACLENILVDNVAETKESLVAAIQKARAYWEQRKTDKFDLSTGPFDAFGGDPFQTYKGVQICYSEASTGNNTTNSIYYHKIKATFYRDVIDCLTGSTYQKGNVMSRQDYQNVIKGMETAINTIQAQITSWTNQIATLTTTKNTLDPTQLYYFSAMNQDKASFVSSAPLQTAYASYMLDQCLPNQQRILESLGEQMTFSNKAARYMNQLIECATNFQACDVYYSLTIYLRQMNLQALPEALTSANKMQSREYARCNADMVRVKQMRDKVKEILAAVEADTEITTAQKRELRLAVKDYRFQVDSLLRNITNLKLFLSRMFLREVTDKNAVDTAFTLEFDDRTLQGNDRLLALFESFVIEGGPNGIIPGGEQQIAQSLEAKHQHYTTFNQNQQLALQLESAALQQEWTLVSAALALMNQILAKLIRRFG